MYSSLNHVALFSSLSITFTVTVTHVYTRRNTTENQKKFQSITYIQRKFNLYLVMSLIIHFRCSEVYQFPSLSPYLK